MTGGVALFDANNDGLLDIFFTNGAAIPSLAKSSAAYCNRLFRNHGDGTFTDVTERAGVQGHRAIRWAWRRAITTTMGSWIFLSPAFNRNQLFHNNGDGTFTDVTAKAGVGGYDAEGGQGVVGDRGVVRLQQRRAAGSAGDQLPELRFGDGGALRDGGDAGLLLAGAVSGDGEYSCTATMAMGRSQMFRGSRTLRNLWGRGWACHLPITTMMDLWTCSFRTTLSKLSAAQQRRRDVHQVGVEAGVAYNGYGNAMAGMGTDFRDIDNDGQAGYFSDFDVWGSVFRCTGIWAGDSSRT